MLGVVTAMPRWYWAVFGALMLACTASFAGVVVERGKAGLSLGGRSRCACGRQLKASENVPVLGWLRVAGTARCCGYHIPRWYLWLEGVSFLAGGLSGWLAGVLGILCVAAGQVTWVGWQLRVRRDRCRPTNGDEQ